MLDREGKREKILEGKLREIRIKLKKQQEQQELLLRQAEKAAEEIKEEPQVKPQLNQCENKQLLSNIRFSLSLFLLKCNYFYLLYFSVD